MKRSKLALYLAVILAVIFAITGCVNARIPEEEEITEENKIDILRELDVSMYEMDLVEGEIPEKNDLSVNTFDYELPDINDYDVDVSGKTENNVDIILSVEDNGSDIRELVKQVGESFNNQHEDMSVTIRPLDPALAEDFIKSKAYVPQGYIASNELYGVLMKSNGINAEKVVSRLTGNTMGIAISDEKYTELNNKYGDVTIESLVKANLDGEISIGYTNPTKNPTGLNFVLSMLASFDSTNPNSIEASTDFSEFQNNVSTVSYSTDQMLKAVEAGTINAFVIERQSFYANLDSGFMYIPFGARHDYPLYKFENTTKEEEQVLIEFAHFFNSSEVQDKATKLGFNKDEDFSGTVSPEDYPVGTVKEVLDFWKKSKSGNKDIVAVFVADVSGSMRDQNKLETLQQSLLNAMSYVSEDAEVGLISYDEEMYLNLPIGKFDTKQQKYFAGAVSTMKEYGGGGTATNNAILCAMNLISEREKSEGKEIKPIIILLSDGMTQSGYTLKSVESLIQKFNYPIYTIGYGDDADEKELKRISDINGGVYTNASTNDVGYTLKTIFNAEM